MDEPCEVVIMLSTRSKRSANRTSKTGLALAAATVLSAATYASDAPAQTFHLASQVVEDGDELPQLYTCDGSNVSPPLSWGEAPQAKTFAITLEDQDARAPKAQRPFMHWIVFNLPPDTRSLAEGMRRGRLPGAAGEGENDFKREGYDGPCPPSGEHRYVFTVHALDTSLDRVKLLKAPWHEIQNAMAGHVIATASLTVSYEKARSR
jgi:hypothetical protein